MKIELLQGCYVDGSACKKGDIVDTAKGAFLIGLGKAKIATSEPKTKKAKNNRKVDDFETR